MKNISSKEKQRLDGLIGEDFWRVPGSEMLVDENGVRVSESRLGSWIGRQQQNKLLEYQSELVRVNKRPRKKSALRTFLERESLNSQIDEEEEDVEMESSQPQRKGGLFEKAQRKLKEFWGEKEFEEIMKNQNKVKIKEMRRTRKQSKQTRYNNDESFQNSRVQERTGGFTKLSKIDKLSIAAPSELMSHRSKRLESLPKTDKLFSPRKIRKEMRIKRLKKNNLLLDNTLKESERRKNRKDRKKKRKNDRVDESVGSLWFDFGKLADKTTKSKIQSLRHIDEAGSNPQISISENHSPSKNTSMVVSRKKRRVKNSFQRLSKLKNNMGSSKYRNRDR